MTSTSATTRTFSRRGLVAGGACALTFVFVGLILSIYRFHPTPGVLFLTLGWMSLIGTGYLLWRAAQSFSLARGDDLPGLANLTSSRRDELEREKKLLVKAIKEVEFDRDMNKLDAPEAADIIARYRSRAVEILRALDLGADKNYEAAIEVELNRRLAAAPPVAVAAAEAGCPSCHTRNDDDARFCKKCGAKLVAEPRAADQAEDDA